MLDKPDATAIHTLRVMGGARDALALQLDMQRALGQSRLAPAGLPDAAILCVRRVRAAIPRAGARAGRGELARQALQSALDALAREAARPARGAVSAQAEAVVFTDRAELLACLTRDWCDGRAAERWWWRCLFRGCDVGAAVVRAWLDTPDYAPAALGQLAERGEAARFVRALEGGAARALLRALVERFALPALRPLLVTSERRGQRAPCSSHRSVAASAPPRTQRRPALPGSAGRPRAAPKG